jgi:hypothetical protein
MPEIKCTICIKVENVDFIINLVYVFGMQMQTSSFGCAINSCMGGGDNIHILNLSILTRCIMMF